MTKPLDQIEHLSLIIADECNIECKHCFVYCHDLPSNPENLMELEHARKYMRELPNLEDVCLYGGEPTLNLDRLIEIIKEATKVGITKSIITDGWWGEDKIVAEEYSRKLKDAGLDNLHISVDAFHQEFVDIDSVKGAIRACQQAGLNCTANGSMLGEKALPNPYDEKTSHFLEGLSEEFGIKTTSSKDLLWIGRAVDKLTDYMPKYPVSDLGKPTCPCPVKEGDIKSPTDSTGCVIDCKGRISISTGITIRDAREQPIADLVRNYPYDDHPLLSVFFSKGIKGLVELAMEKGYEPLKEGYVNAHHIYYHANRFMAQKGLYPDVLAPARFYGIGELG